LASNLIQCVNNIFSFQKYLFPLVQSQKLFDLIGFMSSNSWYWMSVFPFFFDHNSFIWGTSDFKFLREEFFSFDCFLWLKFWTINYTLETENYFIFKILVCFIFIQVFQITKNHWMEKNKLKQNIIQVILKKRWSNNNVLFWINFVLILLLNINDLIYILNTKVVAFILQYLKKFIWKKLNSIEWMRKIVKIWNHL
jgi:hypothetical protein